MVRRLAVFVLVFLSVPMLAQQFGEAIEVQLIVVDNASRIPACYFGQGRC